MDFESKRKILRQLARTAGEKAQSACEREAEKLSQSIGIEKDCSELENHLKLLETFAFRVPETAVSISKNLLAALPETEFENVESVLPSWVGTESSSPHLHFSELVLELLDRIRYRQIQEILEIFFEFSRHSSDELRSKALKGIENTAAYDIDIYFSGENKAGLGPYPQQQVLEFIANLSLEKKQEYSDSITTACAALLSPVMTNTSWDYKSVTWASQPVPVSDEIKSIRQRSIGALIELYGLVSTVSDREKILRSMLTATQTPHLGDYGDDVFEMIRGDTIDVLGFLERQVPTSEMPIVQKIEHDAFWQNRNSNDKKVKESALKVKAAIDENQEYKIYRDLIGFDGIFEDWEADDEPYPDFNAIDEYRTEKAKAYADAINTDNWKEWRERILEFAKTESDDLATYPHFFQFLRNFAESSPNLAFKLLTLDFSRIERFIIPILRGLWNSPLKDDIRSLMGAWIDDGKHLIAVAKLFIGNDDIDDELVALLFDRASADKRDDVLAICVDIALSNTSTDRNTYISRLMVPAIAQMSALGSSRWIHELWYRRNRVEILGSLDPDQMKLLFDAMVGVPDLDYHFEEILAIVAEADLARVLNFFNDRIEYERENKEQSRYRAIPFSFNKLQKSLSAFPTEVVQTVRSWYDGDWVFFQFRGGRLLKNIFPDFSPDLETELVKLVKKGDRTEVEFALSILKTYDGQTFLHTVCQAIVSVLSEDDKLLTEVSFTIMQTGVVTGEYGFVEAYEAKIKTLENWLTNDDQKIRNFASRLIDELKSRAEAERKRAEESIELRKLEYGVREEDGKIGDGGQ